MLTRRHALAALLAAARPARPQPAALPYQPVKDWAQLPKGWNFGECSGVAVDKDDSVWVFNRGRHPVVQFDRTGRMMQAWDEVPVVSSHGIRVDPEGFVWLIDVKGHAVMKFTPQGRLAMRMGIQYARSADNDAKDGFNEPTSVAFARNGDFYVSDGYVNSRVVKFNRDGEYLLHWGKKGTADGEFQLVHDVCLDARDRVYVADRTNERVQVFDPNGRFLAKWTSLGAPWGLTFSPRDGAMFVCDGLNNRVCRVNLEGQVTGTFGTFGKIPGRFDFAHHMAIDSRGDLYVAEIRNWRVQKFARV